MVSKKAADKLRGSMDAAEYKLVVLDLIFLKYISDAFEEQRAKIAAVPGADGEVGGTVRGGNLKRLGFTTEETP